MRTRLVLVRHGEPAETVRGRCYGRLDVHLSSRGHAQAKIAAAKVRALQPTAVYTSPLARARDTALVIADACGLAATIDERLREIDFGAFEGLSWSECEARHPDVYQAWMTRPTTVTFPGGESYQGLRVRALAARGEIAARHAGDTVVLVTHGGVARAVLADALGLPDENVFRIEHSYGALSVVDELDGTPVVRVLNDGWPST
jgi:alpha-ribazole phosphatase/probable phosphoglycerate mutase